MSNEIELQQTIPTEPATEQQAPNLDFLKHLMMDDKENSGHNNNNNPHPHTPSRRHSAVHQAASKKQTPSRRVSMYSGHHTKASPPRGTNTESPSRIVPGPSSGEAKKEKSPSSHPNNKSNSPPHVHRTQRRHHHTDACAPHQTEAAYPPQFEFVAPEESLPQNCKVDYYAILHVPKGCTADDIKRAYRKLALMSHPDRHAKSCQLEGELYENAKDNFQLIKTAYETLIDEKKRMIYDLYGEAGIEAGWALMDIGGKSRAQVKQMFDEISQRQQHQNSGCSPTAASSSSSSFGTCPHCHGAGDDTRVDMKGRITVSLHAQDIVHQVLPGRKALPQVADMAITQSATAIDTPSTRLIMGGTIGQYHGTGHGSLHAELRHMLSAYLWGELRAVATGAQNFLEIGLVARVGALARAYVKFLVWEVAGKVGGVKLGGERQLDPTSSVWAAWTLGAKPEVAIGYRRGFENCEKESDQPLTRYDTSVKYDMFGKVGFGVRSETDISKRMTLELGGEVDQDGYGSLTVGGKRRLGKHKKLGIFVSYEMEGISWGLSYQTGNQEFKVPIVLWSEFSLRNIATAVLTPMLTWTALKLLYLNPQKRKQKQLKSERRRQEMLELTAKRAKESAAAVKLMTPAVLRQKQDEAAKRGLVIVSALYGNLPVAPDFNPAVLWDPPVVPGAEEGSEVQEAVSSSSCSSSSSSSFAPVLANVTIPLQYLVENSQLHLYHGSKESILGFYNPSPETEPRLYVRYLFKGAIHQVFVDDERPLHLPRVSHKV